MREQAKEKKKNPEKRLRAVWTTAMVTYIFKVTLQQQHVGYQLLTSYHSIHTDFISSQLSAGQCQALTNGTNLLSQV
jgi:hypothetical protein